MLGDRPKVALDGNALTLTTEAAKLVLLDRKIAAPDRPLVGTIWTGTTMVEGEAATNSPALERLISMQYRSWCIRNRERCSAMRMPPANAV